MATKYLFSNNATTTLAQSVSATATVLNVASGDGDLFPSPSSGQAFAVTLVDAATGLTNEICYCTSRSGDQLTVIRGQEGTNAIAWSAGDTCANYITADVMESWLQESDLDGYLTQTDAASTYVKKAGDTSTGTQYSAGWFWGGYNAGWGGGTASGQLRWTVCGVSFGNPGGDSSPKYSGNLCVTDVLNDGNNNESGINMRGYDSKGTLYNWFFAWNGRVTTPGGVLAFESDLLSYFSAASNSSNVTLTNLQGVNWTSSATNSYVQVTGNGISLAVPTVAYTSKQVSDEAALREAADTTLQNNINTKLDSSFVASGLFDGSQGSTTSGTIVGGTWMRVGNTMTQNLVIENIGGGTVTFPFEFSGNDDQVTVFVQDGTGSNSTYTTGTITTTGTGIHSAGGGTTGRLHLTASGPYGT